MPPREKSHLPRCRLSLSLSILHLFFPPNRVTNLHSIHHRGDSTRILWNIRVDVEWNLISVFSCENDLNPLELFNLSNPLRANTTSFYFISFAHPTERTWKSREEWASSFSFSFLIPSTIPTLRFKGIVNNASACYAAVRKCRVRGASVGKAAALSRNREECEKPRDRWRG